MLQYVIRRFLYSIVVLVAASFLVFFFVTASGDPLAGLRITPNVSKETVRNIEERKHLNENVFVRYGYWVKDATTNQLGSTLLTNEPILPDLWRVMRNTLQLVIVAELLAIFIAVGIGVYSALRQYSAFDYSATTFSFLGLALPVLVLMIASIATYSRYMRASMLEVVNSDYVRTARAKGLAESRVTMKHAFRNALIPLVTLVALNFGALLGGAVVTETVFSLDGMGLYYISALLTNDPYPIMAWLMVTATLIIVFNLVADIAYGYLDPRVRYD